MSARPNPNQSHYTKNKQRSSPKEQSLLSIERLNQRYKFISEKIWPETPYLLTVPTKHSFRLNEIQTIDLQRNNFFDSSEQPLQYMSFLANNWDNTIIAPVGSWDEDTISISSRSQKMQSASNTPKVAGKKISMSEYKKRAAVAKPETNGSTEKKSERIPLPKPGSSSQQNTLKRYVGNVFLLGWYCKIVG
jgi:hypothetical protein